MKFLPFLARQSVIALLSLLITVLIIAGCVYFYMMLRLPNVNQLKDIRMQVPLRIYTADGQLIAEYGEKKRIPVTLDQVPQTLINAIVATEDQRFFEHGGVDPVGLLRATKELLLTGKKSQGASTITMQVARNFFLSPQKTYTRKINEILLAIKINQTLSKRQILELYLNKIYLGQRAYGVAAAAQIYYGKKLNQLTLPEMAMIAGLPQAPSRDNPITNPAAAKERRNHVLERMLDAGYINQQTYRQAIQAPIDASYHGAEIQVNAPYVGEMVKNMLVAQLGEERTYTEGLKVYTTLNPTLQNAAETALKKGLIQYDQRHGWRGPEANWSNSPSNSWLEQLQAVPDLGGLIPAVVLHTTPQDATLLLRNNTTITLPWSSISWAKAYRESKYPGSAPISVSQILRSGDLVRVLKTDEGWKLAQLPKVEGAIVSMDPRDGAILALDGGFSFDRSHFNRVTQALRQPGSNFKPFIYAAALAKGLTLATMINDAPLVINDTGDKNNLWRPQNNEQEFYGPTRLRVGLIKSRNLVSIRILRQIGIPYALKYMSNFGFDATKLPYALSLALGSADVTPLEMVRGYAVFANGGYLVNPYIINKIEDNDGNLIYQAAPNVACVDSNCDASQLKHPAARTIDADVAYLINNALQDVIVHGTGRGALVIGRNDIAGKTGTTNQQMDAWFSGFNPHIATTVWVGFDQPKTLYEYGAEAALPIWVDYMKVALKDQPEVLLPTPADIVMVRIDPDTGLLAAPGQKNAIFEMFRKDNVPSEYVSAGQSSDDGQSGNSDMDMGNDSGLF